MLTAPYSLCLPGLPTNGKPIFCLVQIFLWFLVCLSLSDFLCVFLLHFLVRFQVRLHVWFLVWFFSVLFLVRFHFLFHVRFHDLFLVLFDVRFLVRLFARFLAWFLFRFCVRFHVLLIVPFDAWFLFRFLVHFMAVFVFFCLFRVLVRFFLQPAQTLWEFVDFQFVRECMKINKIRLKFHFLTKIEIKMTYLVFFFLCFTVSSPLELFGSRFIDV